MQIVSFETSVELLSVCFHRQGKIINEESEREETDTVWEITSVYLAFHRSRDFGVSYFIRATTMGGRCYSCFRAQESEAQQVDLKKCKWLTQSHVSSQHLKPWFNARILMDWYLELLYHIVILCLTFWGIAKLLPAASFYIPTSSAQGSDFSISSAILVIFHFFG